MNKLTQQGGVFITEELGRRSARPPDYKREKDALRELLAQMATAPEDVLPKFVALAMDLTGGSSAGISLLETEPAPGLFRWRYLRGALAPFEDAVTPRDDSPCGVTLEQNGPVLAAHPERAYDWIAALNLIIPEVLLVPIYVGSERPFGTLWIVAEEAGHFRQEHARLSGDMAEFIGTALRMLQAEAELREALRAQELMAREMSHRVKNVFALVQSMVRLSAKGTDTAEALADAVSGRLVAMAAAHGLVRREQAGGEATTVETIVSAILKPYVLDGGEQLSQIQFSGPSVQCGEAAASGLSLVLHELATNAAKYGALSSPKGRLAIDWTAGDGNLTIVWCESGCSLEGDDAPSLGFGTSLIDRTTRSQFDGTFQREWRPGGVACTIEVPLAKLKD